LDSAHLTSKRVTVESDEDLTATEVAAAVDEAGYDLVVS
jgi:copper chaperone CopZ